MINDNTPITAEILLRNGWDNTSGDIFRFSGMTVEHIDGFCTQYEIGLPFIYIGELKAIARALYKVELKFE